jgi:hypothetical protein
MDINKIDEMLIPAKRIGLTRQYGVMGLVLGKELHARLTSHCTKRNIPKSKVIRALIISYLDEKENK